MRESTAFEGGALLLESKNSAGEMGHRIAKHVYTSADVWEKSTYYVLDAQGNTLSTYEYINDNQTQTLTYAQTEKHIYGSSRLGVNTEVVPMFGSQNATYSMKLVLHKIGQRTYELSNHLGNVLSIISDKVIPHQNGSSADYWLADIRHSQDYSPFGVTLHGRDLSLSTTGNKPYRYGFNGMEGDDEVKGEGNSYTTEFRQYDPRLGRWLSIDPLTDNFPSVSPYISFDNNPIVYVDQNGLSPTNKVENQNSGTTDASSSEKGASPGIKSINFGLFTITIRKGAFSRTTGIKKIGLDFDWNYTFSRESKSKTKWKTERFTINTMDYDGVQSTPNTGNYTPTTVGASENSAGKTLNELTSALKKSQYVIKGIRIKTKLNDHGGDSFYQFNIGGQVVNHNNINRRSILDPTNITPNTNVNGALVRQTPAADGFYDSCDGYKLIIRVQYKYVKTVSRIRLVRRDPTQ